MLTKLGTPSYQVQQMVNDYRTGRYRAIIPDQPMSAAVNLEAIFDGLGGQWYTLSTDSPLAGQTLAQANVRSRTGATIMAVKRNKTVHRHPDAQTTLEQGDRLLVIGNAKEQAAFEQLLG